MRQLRRPSESSCRIFDGPQLKEKCLKGAVFGRLALLYTWIKVGFGGHKCITEELGGAFLSLSPEPVASNLCKAGFRQFFSAVFLRNLIVRQAGLSRKNPSWSWVYECRGRLAGSNKEFYRCLQITVRSLNQPNPADHHLFINKTLPEAQRIQTIEPKQIQILA